MIFVQILPTSAFFKLSRPARRICVLCMWVIDQAPGQDGWILAELFFHMFILVHKHAKKE